MKVYFNCHVRELAASCIGSVEPLSGHFSCYCDCHSTIHINAIKNTFLYNRDSE